MTRSKSIIRVALLIFVWVSIGYALGKEVTVRRMQADAPGQVAPVKGDQVVVYYMFPAIRCVTCNQIHEAAHRVVHQDLADALESGRLRWEEVNISENEALAARYNVATSVVVVVHRRDGEDVSLSAEQPCGTSCKWGLVLGTYTGQASIPGSITVKNRVRTSPYGCSWPLLLLVHVLWRALADPFGHLRKLPTRHLVVDRHHVDLVPPVVAVVEPVAEWLVDL